MKIAFTGHRSPRLQGRKDEIREWLDNKLDESMEEAFCGMAEGGDQLFGEVCIKNNIPIRCCYPFKKTYFNKNEKKIISHSIETIFLFENYFKASYWYRDKYMVDNCDTLFAVWDGKKNGGTWLTIKYAREIGKPIIYFMLGEEE